MSRDPLSDDEVEEDGDDYVPVRVGIDSAVRKSKVQMKTYSVAYSGPYIPGVPGIYEQAISANCFSDSDFNYAWNGSCQWAWFYPSVGTGVDDLQNGDTCVVDGIKYAINAFVPVGSLVDDDQPPWETSRTQWFTDLIFSPECPPYFNGPADPEGRLSWAWFYEPILRRAAGPVAFLKRERVREGCFIVKRWAHTLDRELYNATGKAYDSKVWSQAATGLGPTLGGDLSAGTAGEQLYEIGQKNFIMNYTGQAPGFQELWPPAQYQYAQFRNYFTDSGYVKVKRTVQVFSKYTPGSELYPNLVIRRGYFFLCTWADCDVTHPGGSSPNYAAYSACPQVEVNLRFKFHQKY